MGALERRSEQGKPGLLLPLGPLLLLLLLLPLPLPPPPPPPLPPPPPPPPLPASPPRPAGGGTRVIIGIAVGAVPACAAGSRGA